MSASATPPPHGFLQTRCPLRASAGFSAPCTRASSRVASATGRALNGQRDRAEAGGGVKARAGTEGWFWAWLGPMAGGEVVFGA